MSLTPKVSKIKKETSKAQKITSRIRIRPAYWRDPDIDHDLKREPISRTSVVFSQNESFLLNILGLLFGGLIFFASG